MEAEQSIRFIVDKQDKFLLAQIAKQDGKASMSATIRRLISDEAKRRGIEVSISSTDSNPAEN